MSKPPDDGEMIGMAEAAALLHVSLRTIFRLIKAGKLPQPVRFSRKLTRFRKAELLEWFSRLT